MESVLYRDQSGSVVAEGYQGCLQFTRKNQFVESVVNGPRQILNGNFQGDALAPVISTTFSRKIRNFSVSLEL